MPDSDGQSKSADGTYPLQFFKGVGPAKAQLLAKMGIYTQEDLATTYPRTWEDRRRLYTIAQTPMGQKTTLSGVIRSATISMTRGGLGIATATIDDGTGLLTAVWFKKTNPRYDVFGSLRQKLIVDKYLIAWGLMEWGTEGRQLRVDDAAIGESSETVLAGDEHYHFDRIVPVYTVPEGMSDRLLRSLIGRALPLVSQTIPDAVPESFRIKPREKSKSWALMTTHFPTSLVEMEEARRRLAFEEFFVLETALGLLRNRVKKEAKPHRYQLKKTILTPFREALGFDLTGAQKRVIREIFDDLMRPAPMNRLLQGDVGSGKTIVALCAMLLAVENGGQAALMVPTEILAEQHAMTFRRLLKNFNVRCTVLTGRQAVAKKSASLKAIAAGEMDLIIGTHAVIQHKVKFKNLMLSVIDEQHRFGVEHRRMLRGKGTIPDVLVMTATPIPRTLALTIYGDLDVSVIDELPPGRTPIETLRVSEEEAYHRIRQEVRAGRQAYVVYPLVSESDKLELKAAVQEAALLKETAFKGLRVDVLHGQMPGREKESVMERFRTGALDILIATTIIEVGIDVPNATLMAIQHAERFGLATLHQLRGRVGRGAHRSVCLLIADARGDDSRRRMQIMTETTDGFRLSEEDLSLRGPGEVMGLQQHGLPTFKIGRLVEDTALIQQARQSSLELLHADPLLTEKSHQPLRAAIRLTYESRWSLGITG